MGRLIDVDNLCSCLGFKDTQEERDNNYAEDITLEEIDRIETVNVAEREEVKKLIREAKKKAIEEFYNEIKKEAKWGMHEDSILPDRIVKISRAADIKEQLKEKYLKGERT